MIRVATVFSGIGAVEFALRRMGVDHRIIFACDNGDVTVNYDREAEFRVIRNMKDASAKKRRVDDLYAKRGRPNHVKTSYMANYDLTEAHFHQDVRLLDGRDYRGRVDFFVGGSPCQSFSSVGFQKGFDDDRGGLFFHFIRLVDEIQPKVFLFENVRSLITNAHLKAVILKEFEKLGYSICPLVLNAADYGIPQRRRRLFVVGFREEPPSAFKMNEPIPLVKTMQDFLIDTMAEGEFRHDAAGCLVFGKKPGAVDESCILSPKVQRYVLKGGTRSWYQKPETDLKIARTLLSTMANHHRAGVDNYVTLPDGRLRALSGRECLRLMGFTDDFRIKVPPTRMYRQAGNSIVVDVLMNIIESIMRTGVFADGKRG